RPPRCGAVPSGELTFACNSVPGRRPGRPSSLVPSETTPEERHEEARRHIPARARHRRLYADGPASPGRGHAGPVRFAGAAPNRCEPPGRSTGEGRSRPPGRRPAAGARLRSRGGDAGRDAGAPPVAHAGTTHHGPRALPALRIEPRAPGRG